MVWISRFLWICLIGAVCFTLSTYLSYKSPLKVVPSHHKKKASEANENLSLVIDYENLGEGFLGTKTQRIKKSFQEAITYLGANSRPDYPTPIIFCSFQGQAWAFNDDQEYPLSILLEDQAANDYSFKVSLNDSQAHFEILYQQSPSFYFTTPCTEIAEKSFIDNYKLDTYILVRQKVAWLGQDLFLKEHGGEDFSFAQESQRLDFLHSQTPYFIFAKTNDLFSWREGRWQRAQEDSREHPLMKVDKIEGLHMNISIWDIAGRHKESLLLTRSSIGVKDRNVLPLKYIGAKSSQKWLIKSNKERFSIEPGDWLVHLGHKWEKIDSLGSINLYINKLNMGELFIIRELLDKNGKKYLIGDLFNASRTEKSIHQMDISKSEKKYNKPPKS